MKNFIKDKSTLAVALATVTVVGMSFRPADNTVIQPKTVEVTKSAPVQLAQAEEANATIAVVAWAVSRAVIAATAETSITIILNGAKSNSKMGTVETKEYLKNVQQVRMQQIDQKK